MYILKSIDTKAEKPVTIRTMGHDFAVSKEEAEQYLTTGQLYWKANKPVTEKEFKSRFV